MAQFLRFSALIILALIGFGSGICGLFGLGASAIDALHGHGGGGGGENFTGVVVMFSVIGVVVAIGCFFAVRALARSLRAHTTPIEAAPPGAPTSTPTPPPAPPPSGPPPAA
jgi:hypothetical protein